MRTKKKNLPALTGIILVLAMASVWFGIRHFQNTAKAKNAAEYDSFTVKRMDLSEKIDATGNVITEKNSSLYSPYSATVKEILAKPGQEVHKGDVLLVLQLKDADVINYAAGYKSSLEQAKENLLVAQNALKRQETLYKIQGTTIDELENAQKTVRQYQAQVSEYELKLGSLIKNGVDQNNNVLIKAPFDAEVSWINVKDAQAVSTTDELLTLGGASVVMVEADIDQGDISQIKEGQMATITANDENRTVIPGIVTAFGSTGTVSSNVVTFPVNIKPLNGTSNMNQNVKWSSGLRSANGRGSSNSAGTNGNRPSGPTITRPNGNRDRSGTQGSTSVNSSQKPSITTKLGDLLKVGMTVDVSIMVNSHRDVLTIPLRALTQVNGENIVKVLQNGQYVSKKVELGFQSDRYVEITSGLNEGDQVAIPKTQAYGGTGTDKNNIRIRSGIGGRHM